MSYNSDIVTALKAGKRFLQHNERDERYVFTNKHKTISGFKDNFICLAILEARLKLFITKAQEFAAINVIEQRLTKNMTVEDYLRQVVKVPASELTFDNMQAFRHRWVDALIVEFSQ